MDDKNEELILKMKLTKDAYGIAYTNAGVANYYQQEIINESKTPIKKETIVNTLDNPYKSGNLLRTPLLISAGALIISLILALLVGCTQKMGNLNFNIVVITFSCVVSIGTGLGIIIAIIVGISNARDRKKKITAYEASEKDRAKKQALIDKKYNEALEARNTKIKIYEKRKNEYLEYTETALKVYKKLLKTNYVYITYQDVIPICQFIQYLESGRCSSLEGENGCYNLYETELRNGVITNDQLTIADHYDSYMKNQFIVATLFKKALEPLPALKNATMLGRFDTYEMKENMRRIEACASISSYTGPLTKEKLRLFLNKIA